MHQFRLAFAIFRVLKICSSLLVGKRSGKLQIIVMTLCEIFHSIYSTFIPLSKYSIRAVHRIYSITEFITLYQAPVCVFLVVFL